MFCALEKCADFILAWPRWMSSLLVMAAQQTILCDFAWPSNCFVRDSDHTQCTVYVCIIRCRQFMADFGSADLDDGMFLGGDDDDDDDDGVDDDDDGVDDDDEDDG